jgi:hypothetical protein
MKKKSPSRIEKLERNGHIAVLYTDNFSAGWSTDWYNDGVKEMLLFDREIIEPLLESDFDAVRAVVARKYPTATASTIGDCLRVAWVLKGARFYVYESDGREEIRIIGPDFGHVA